MEMKCANFIKWLAYLVFVGGVITMFFQIKAEYNFAPLIIGASTCVSSVFVYALHVIVKAAAIYINKNEGND